jgi:WD40 repeat protein
MSRASRREAAIFASLGTTAFKEGFCERALGLAIAVITKLSEHTDAVNGAVFSSDGFRVVTAADDDTARVWDARIGATLARTRSACLRRTPTLQMSGDVIRPVIITQLS